MIQGGFFSCLLYRMSVRRERKWLRGMRGHYQKKKNVQSTTQEVLTRKASLNVGMLNIEGQREDKMEDVTRAMRIKDLDIMVIWLFLYYQ